MKTFSKILFLLILSFFIGCNFCFAAEDISLQLGNDYLLTTDENIKTNLVSDSSILTINPFFTIFNEKNVLLIHPLRAGKTNVTIFLNKSESVFKITVKQNKGPVDKKSITKGPFEIMLLDVPPSLDEIKKTPAKTNWESK